MPRSPATAQCRGARLDSDRPFMLFFNAVPTYEYKCDDCGVTFEVRQRISEPSLTRCQRCGGPVRRVLSAAPFILKGTGFYVNDYPSEARKQALTAEKKGGSDGSASSSPPASSPTPSASPSAPDS